MEASELTADRDFMGLSKTELAKRLDISVKTVQRWESGEVKIPGSKVSRIRQALEIKEEQAHDLWRCTDGAHGEQIPETTLTEVLEALDKFAITWLKFRKSTGAI